MFYNHDITIFISFPYLSLTTRRRAIKAATRFDNEIYEVGPHFASGVNYLIRKVGSYLSS